jgi:hypothetical protein
MDGACTIHRREISAFKILVRKHEGKISLEDLGVDGRISKWILKKQGERIWAAAI